MADGVVSHHLWEEPSAAHVFLDLPCKASLSSQAVTTSFCVRTYFLEKIELSSFESLEAQPIYCTERESRTVNSDKVVF